MKSARMTADHYAAQIAATIPGGEGLTTDFWVAIREEYKRPQFSRYDDGAQPSRQSEKEREKRLERLGPKLARVVRDRNEFGNEIRSIASGALSYMREGGSGLAHVEYFIKGLG
jgi:hypothetical protein